MLIQSNTEELSGDAHKEAAHWRSFQVRTLQFYLIQQVRIQKTHENTRQKTQPVAQLILKNIVITKIVLKIKVFV